ncbi:MAG TPA: formate hydrogenlyase, partial [Candidatus Dormibacteraeota bacterium]|nr:formate hydrogenlyase [Candidatus Dormibacteraeota bacterium]
IIPVGLAATFTPVTIAIAIAALALKMLVAAVLIVFIESAIAKIRILRIPEFLGASFVLAVLALVIYSLGQ